MLLHLAPPTSPEHVMAGRPAVASGNPSNKNSSTASAKTIDKSSAMINIDNVIAVSISSFVPRQQAWRTGVKRGTITRRHGLEGVLARGATIAAHLIATTADGEHPAYRAVVTPEQKVRCASDKCSHFSELQQTELQFLWPERICQKHSSDQSTCAEKTSANERQLR